MNTPTTTPDVKAPSRTRRRWPRYSLRTLLVLVSACCVALSMWVVPAERQRRAVEAVRAAGGYVRYDFEATRGGRPPSAWLVKVLGVDYLAEPVFVSLPTTARDADVAHCQDLAGLQTLLLDGSRVSDVGLEHLGELKYLKVLWLNGSRVTAEGCQKLRETLPACRIYR